MADFNWLELIPAVTYYGDKPGEVATHVATMGAAGIFLCAAAIVGRAALGQGESAITPASRFSIKGFFEGLTEFIIGLSETVMGERGLKYAPLFAPIFFFILINNLVGLLPGMTPATEKMSTTLALGLFSFFVFHYYGIKENGVSYIKHFTVLPLKPAFLILIPLMLLIELISSLLRPLTLGLRLQANMMGDHMILSTFYDLIPWLVPVFVYVIGVFVCFMQAFIFTLLSIIYVAMATAHDH